MVNTARGAALSASCAPLQPSKLWQRSAHKPWGKVLLWCSLDAWCMWRHDQQGCSLPSV